MIFKSLSRRGGLSSATQKSSSISQLAKYVLRYTSGETPTKEKATLILKHNIRGRGIKGYIEAYTQNEAFRVYRRKDNVLVFHDILSFSPNDVQKLTNAKLKEIAVKYVELRGSDNLFLITKHQDTLATHLHIVASGVKTNGRSNRISQAQFKHIKLELEKFQRQRFPELKASEIRHGKQKTKEEIVEAVKQIRTSNKEKLQKLLSDIETASLSKQEFYDRVREQGLQIYSRNNSPQGIFFEEKKYRFSKLGFTNEVLDKIEIKQCPENIALRDLQLLREGTTKNRMKQLVSSSSKVLNAEQETLNELARLRTQTLEQTRELVQSKEVESANIESGHDLDADVNLNLEQNSSSWNSLEFSIPTIFQNTEEE